MRRANLLIPVVCSAAAVAIAFALPSYFPLIEPDSAGYIEFAASRTALYPVFLRLLTRAGLTLDQVVYVQGLLLFAGLTVLLGALLRAGVGRLLVLLVAIAFGANGYFSSLERTIMTESLALPVTLVAVAFWIDYLRTGRAAFLALVAFCVGLTIGIRPAGILLLPMVVVAAWLKWHRRDVGVLATLAAMVLPMAIGPLAERLLYRAEHGTHSESISTPILLGKAAMLVRPDTVFTGPHAGELGTLGSQMAATYQPVHHFLAGLPSLVAYPVLTAGYESVAQFSLFNQSAAALAARAGIAESDLVLDLARQAIIADIPGYLRLSLTHYLGQWSITALRFPPTARAVNAYVAATPNVPLDGVLGDVYLRPTASLRAYAVYPAFVLAGVATLALSLVLIGFIVRPRRGDAGRPQDLMLAAFFAASCQSVMLLTSFVNTSTPRFLMAVYPQLVMAGLFLLLALRRRPLSAAPA